MPIRLSILLAIGLLAGCGAGPTALSARPAEAGVTARAAFDPGGYTTAASLEGGDGFFRSRGNVGKRCQMPATLALRPNADQFHTRWELVARSSDGDPKKSWPMLSRSVLNPFKGDLFQKLGLDHKAQNPVSHELVTLFFETRGWDPAYNFCQVELRAVRRANGVLVVVR